jgi:hypothetical protein
MKAACLVLERLFKQSIYSTIGAITTVTKNDLDLSLYCRPMSVTPLGLPIGIMWSPSSEEPFTSLAGLQPLLSISTLKTFLFHKLCTRKTICFMSRHFI